MRPSRRRRARVATAAGSFLSNPEKKSAPSNRRAEGRSRDEQRGEQCFHRVECDERVNREWKREGEAPRDDRELREPAKKEHRTAGERGEPATEQRCRAAHERTGDERCERISDEVPARRTHETGEARSAERRE